jgi:RNA polymerase sigma-70 factor, ECF subfamily
VSVSLGVHSGTLAQATAIDQAPAKVPAISRQLGVDGTSSPPTGVTPHGHPDIQHGEGHEKGAGAIDRQERFAAMYEQYERRVLGYALRRAPVETAKDAAADAFLAAWRRFDELPDDPLPWLIETTRRTLANQRRTATRQARLAERLQQDESRQPEAAFAGRIEDRPVRAALGQLSVVDRELLALVAWEGLTPAQAAHSLGCSAVALRVRLHRARRRFERALAEAERTVGSFPPAEGARPAATVKEVS